MTNVIPTVMNRIGEPSASHVRNRAPALFQMPYHMWQPINDRPNPYHSSHCDRAQLGWRKWGTNHPDWYAKQAQAWHPDWYQRRVDTIRHQDTKERLWPWELTSKPTEKRVYGISREPQQPWQRGYQAVPHDIDGQVLIPKWGLYNPPHYQDPNRAEPLPPIHVTQKHV